MRRPGALSRPGARAALVAGAAVILGVTGWLWLHRAGSSVTTDDAYVRADLTFVSPLVRGQVTQVLVAENTAVAAGEPLARIDPAEYDAQVAGARGDMMAAQASEGAARAGLARLDAEEALAKSQIGAAKTLAGTAGLANPALRDAFAAARGQSLVAARGRGEIEAARISAKAAEFRAGTALAWAMRQRDATVVRAPVAGLVGDLQVEPGAFVQPGVRLMTIVRPASAYVTANFKETQTGAMIARAPAKVRIDALPGVVFAGKVASLAPASGSQFALLPFEPGTGNFTKIVQRIPVRIALDPGQAGLSRLRPGLSAEVTVKLARAAAR